MKALRAVLLVAFLGLLAYRWLRPPIRQTVPAAVTITEAKQRAGFPVRVPVYLPKGSFLRSVHVIEQPPLPAPKPPKIAPEILAGTATTVGIGVELSRHPRGWVVAEVVNGGAAEAAGVVKGDVVTAIDGHNCRGMGVRDVRAHLGGKPGGVVALLVRRGDAEKTIQVERTRYHIPAPKVSPPTTSPEKPLQTVVLQYQYGANEFLLYETKEAGQTTPIAEEVRPVDINGTTALLGLNRAGKRRSLIWSRGGTTYFLSDYQGVIGTEEMVRIGHSLPDGS